MPPVITALYGALNAIFNVLLATEVTRLRRRHGVSLGHGSERDKALNVAVRAHGNNAEFVPLALLMLLIAELCGGASWALHALGGSLFAARIAHWIGLPRKAPNAYRAGGIVITWLGILTTAGYVLYLRTTIPH